MPEKYEELWTEFRQWIINYEDCRKMPDDFVRTLFSVNFMPRFNRKNG